MQKIRKKLSLVWGVPEAAVMNIPVVTVQGNGTASIENYKSILLYTS